MNKKSTLPEVSRLELTGQLLKEKRLENGWSQDMLANRIKDITRIPISKHAISKWERNENSQIKAEPWNIKAIYQLFYDETTIPYDLFSNLVKQYAHIENKVKIIGKYNSIWGFDNEQNPEVIEFSMNEDIVIGSVIKGPIDYILYGFLFSDKILSGFWLNKHDGHHGNVLLEFTFDYKKASGNWIGTFDRHQKNKNEQFKYGFWELYKID